MLPLTMLAGDAVVTDDAGGPAGTGPDGPEGGPRRFRNPVIPGFHPDPSVCRIGPDFFLVTSSFEYFPGLPLFHSQDLVTWRQIGYCLSRPGQVDLSTAPSSKGIFAPTIRHHQGTTYVTATNVSSGGHFIVSTRDPFGPWSEPVWVAQDGIDPSLFFEGGTAYFASTIEPDPDGPHPARPPFQRAIQQSVVDVTTGALLDGPRLVWAGTGGKYPEGPHLLRRGEFYYLLIAEGGTEYGHMVTVARARSPWGPFEPDPGNPILTHRSTDSPFQAVGHADLAELADGSWWLVCLGVRPHGQWPCHHLGRETFLAPVTWTADGWPRVGQRGMLEETGPAPALPAPALPAAAPPAAGTGDEPAEVAVVDDFDAAALGLAWNFVRTPRPERWSLSARPGWLRLACGPPDLDDLDIVFTGRRQEHLRCRASGLVELDAGLPADESGLVVRMNERHHYEVAVTGPSAQRQVITRLRIGPASQQVASRPVPAGPVELWIEATQEEYRFGYTVPGGAGGLLGTAPTRYLSSEVAGGFTGVFLGLYATSHGHPAGGTADWDWFRYQGGP